MLFEEEEQVRVKALEPVRERVEVKKVVKKEGNSGVEVKKVEN